MIGALLRTHAINLARDRVAQLMRFVLPIAFFSIFALIFGGQGSEGEMVSFYAGGVAVMFLLFSSSAAAGTLLEEVDSGTLDRLLTSRLGMTRLLAGKWLWVAIAGMLQIVVMFVWAMVAFRLDLVSHLPGFLVMTAVSAATAASFGLLLATACRTRGEFEVVQRHQAGMSIRSIAQELGISRGAVVRTFARVQAQRAGQAAPGPRPRASILDPFEPILKELLGKYPNLTVERALQELRGRGFRGGYTVVRQRVRLLRPRPAPVPVPRFETGPGAQAQMDYGVYDLDFDREGRRRVYLFSYLLGYSRRQYLRWVESMDLLTTLREHVHAFRHLGGAARVCLYDNFKAVVLWRDADGPLYNPKFLAFATHYGFRPQACRVRRPQTKGKCERQFFYVEKSLLNGRSFESLEHLNEVTAQWLDEVANVRILRDFQESPRQRHEREQPQLLPLPACDFDTALVVYRHVNVEGFITYRLNFYSVPWSCIGQVLPVRVLEDEVIIYSVGLEEIARHRCVPSSQSGVRQTIKSHHPQDDPGQRTLLLQQRFGELGPIAVQFLEGLLAKQIQGKLQAQQLLALLAHYQRDDVLAALERAVRFGAFSLAAMRRILAAQARPKPLLQELADLHKDTLDPSLRAEPIGPRPTSDYQHLLAPERTHEAPSQEKPIEPRDRLGNRSDPA